jgi:hypothetical protein
MTRSPLLSIVPIIFSMAALAETPASSSGRMFFEWCTSKEGSIGLASCLMYATGFVHGVMIAGGKDSGGVMCLPPGFTGEGARAVFVHTMRTMGDDNPFLDESVDLALAASLAKAFPCMKKSN